MSYRVVLEGHQSFFTETEGADDDGNLGALQERTGSGEWERLDHKAYPEEWH